MTVDVQMDSGKGDVEMLDADKDAQSCEDDRKEPTNDINDATLESKEEEIPCLPTLDQSKSTQKQDIDEPVQGEQSKVSVSQLGEGTAESKVEGQLIKSEGKPDAMVSQKIQDCQNVPRDVEDKQNIAQAGKEYSSNVKSETTIAVDLQDEAKEQSGNGVANLAKSGTDSAQLREIAEDEKNQTHKEQLLFQLPVSEVPPKRKEAVDEIRQSEKEETVKKILDKAHQSRTEVMTDELKGTDKSNALPTDASENIKMAEKTEVAQSSIGNTPVGNKRLPATPDIKKQSSVTGSGDHHGRVRTSAFSEVKMTESDEGTPAEQAAFMKELEVFYRTRDVDFKPPKFYGQMLNCLKLWRAVIKLGGYDLVTGSKLWRQVGESFHPPKTCTTVSWTFRIFYEKSLLEYERYLRQIGELQLPETALSEPSSVDNEGNGHQASGSGRARRDAAARAMQGWHAQRLFSHGEEKNVTSMPKRENKIKSIGSIKQKRPDEVELPVKAQRTETSKQLRLSATVVDVGPSADWVKINVRETKDCFEVYALVPGLLREEVRVQSDPAGRLVITGQPEQPDNPWGITAFKKVVTLPARIDPLQTSAVVSLHGRLFVRVPFEQPQI